MMAALTSGEVDREYFIDGYGYILDHRGFVREILGGMPLFLPQRSNIHRLPLRPVVMAA